MKGTIKCFILILLPVSFLTGGAKAMGENHSSSIRKILECHREHLHRVHSPDSENLTVWLAGLDDAGRWEDIDYADDKRGNWDLLKHVSRLRDLALALSSGETAGLPGVELERAALNALDDWLAHRYRATNWWFNEIGVPRFMRDIAILLDGRLSAERRAGLLEVIDQHRVRGTGANLLWTAELALHSACLRNDAGAAAEAAIRIRGEIVVGNREGIQEDWSFFQHSARLQTFHYGLSFLKVAVPLGWQLRETPWQYTTAEMAILTNLLLEGAQWMLRGNFTVPSTLDRSVTRPGQLQIDLLPYVELWAMVDVERRAELEAFAGRLAGQKAPISGFRHFENADFTAYHRPGFSFFVKTISNRTFLTETMNNENLLGRDLHTGDHYLLRDGDEYFDLMPVWDWDRLPGIASGSGMETIVRFPFVGGLGDGVSGIAAMDTQRRAADDEVSLALRRSWFFHGDAVVALCGGWEAGKDGLEPFVVLDQSRLRGEVVVLEGPERSRRLGLGEHVLTAPLAILHDSVAWFPLGAPEVSVRQGPAQGAWRRINRNHSDELVTQSVFLATMHYEIPEPEGGGFVVAAGVSAEGAGRIMANPPWAILRNDRSVQAVEFDGGIAMAAFFQTGSVEFSQGGLSASRPCLVFWRGDTILAADPAWTGGPVEIRVNGETLVVELPANGRSVSVPRERGD